ncbi:hypothetical protein [Kitasatospora paranensis]|uniref:hypothetical protein n=1 Tax=Kitasatospora paranensis TaxID=258053 RepID=UPI0031E53C17
MPGDAVLGQLAAASPWAATAAAIAAVVRHVMPVLPALLAEIRGWRNDAAVRQGVRSGATAEQLKALQDLARPLPVASGEPGSAPARAES